MGQIRIGISGWTYPPWRGRFYPKGWPQHRELEYAARQVSSIEINGSFYSLQRPESYRAWYEATPEGFVFSIKGSRFITHMKRLKDVETPLANFFASGVLRLAEKLGPFLWQFPPNFRFDRERLRKFFALLPRDTCCAAALAKKHDDRLSALAWKKTDQLRPAPPRDRSAASVLRNAGLYRIAPRARHRHGRRRHRGQVATHRGCHQ